MGTEPHQVLLADDSDASRTSLSRFVESLGHTVIRATTNEEVFARVETSRPDVILLGVRSSRINAYQVLRRLQNIAGAPPVIVFSTPDGVEGVAKCLEMGAADYIMDPLHPTLIRTRLDDCIEAQRLRREREQASIEQQRAEEALQAREKYERDVHIGRQIQRSFLPTSLPRLPDWEIAAQFQPAREVAGDWYDAFLLPQINRVGIVIADVCDKGVGAALFMGLMRSLLRAFAQQPTSLRWLDAIDGESPIARGVSVAERRRSLPTAGTTALKNAIEQTNNYIAKNHGETGMFATVFFGILDPRSGQLLYINAGHEKPAIVGREGVRERLEPTGTAVGMMPDSDYSIGSAQLHPGEILVTYTDGVPEARDSDRKFFTESRLLGLLNDPPPSAAALLDRVVDSVRAHIADADQYDDVTLLAVRRGTEALT